MIEKTCSSETVGNRKQKKYRFQYRRLKVEMDLDRQHSNQFQMDMPAQNIHFKQKSQNLQLLNIWIWKLESTGPIPWLFMQDQIMHQRLKTQKIAWMLPLVFYYPCQAHLFIALGVTSISITLRHEAKIWKIVHNITICIMR